MTTESGWWLLGRWPVSLCGVLTFLTWFHCISWGSWQALEEKVREFDNKTLSFWMHKAEMTSQKGCDPFSCVTDRVIETWPNGSTLVTQEANSRARMKTQVSWALIWPSHWSTLPLKPCHLENVVCSLTQQVANPDRDLWEQSYQRQWGRLTWVLFSSLSDKNKTIDPPLSK